MSGAQNPLLGVFGRPGFAPELRLRIYQACVDQRSTNLFRANRAFWQESEPLLREGFVLRLHIDPRAPGSIVYLVNRNGDLWGISRNIIDVKSAHDDCEILDSMPIDRFKQIQICIEAPEPDDPGQLMRCWYQTKRLLAILLPRWRHFYSIPRVNADLIIPPARGSTRLPEFVVTFQDEESRKWWSWRGHSPEWIRSLPCSKPWLHHRELFNPRPVCTEGDGEQRTSCSECVDFRRILELFLKVRNARGFKLNIAFPNNREVRDMRRRLEISAVSTHPFAMILPTLRGVFINRDHFAFDDEMTLKRENIMHLCMEYGLHELRGPTIEALRTERYQN